VVKLAAEGNSNKQIARALDLSVKTVETHRSAAMQKAGARCMADLTRYAARNDIVQL
jgi:DNA-binding NarL/FixJ family response regulator